MTKNSEKHGCWQSWSTLPNPVDQQLDQAGAGAYLRLMGRQVNLYEAKTSLSRLVEEAANGDTIIIAKDGKPMAQLCPIGAAGPRQPRKLGQLARHAKGTDWVQWWREWKAADKEIENDFEASARRPLAPGRARRRG